MPGGHQGGVPGNRLGGPEGQPGGGSGGHDHWQGHPGVDALPDEGGAVHPDVDESQLALHPQRERVDLWDSIAGDPASEAAVQLNGGPIWGVFCTACANFLSNSHRLHSGKKRQGERRMWGLRTMTNI